MHASHASIGLICTCALYTYVDQNSISRSYPRRSTCITKHSAMQVSAPSSRMAASAAAAAPCIARRSRTLPAMRTQCSTSFAVRPPIMTQRRHTMRGQALVVHMGIRAVENFDSAFELSQECRSSLTELLSTDTFCQQVGTGWCDSNFWSYTCYAILAFSGPVALVIAVCHLFAYTAHISYSQVTRETQQQEGTRLRFADILFQPVPWSVQTKKVANHLRVGQPAPSMLSSTRRAGRRSMTSLWLIFGCACAGHACRVRAVPRRPSICNHQCATQLHVQGQDIQAVETVCYLQDCVTLAKQCCIKN